MAVLGSSELLTNSTINLIITTLSSVITISSSLPVVQLQSHICILIQVVKLPFS